MKKILFLVLALLAAPAFADTVQSISYNPITKQLNALTKQNGTQTVYPGAGEYRSDVGSGATLSTSTQTVASLAAANSKQLTAGTWDITVCFSVVGGGGSQVGAKYGLATTGASQTGWVDGDNSGGLWVTNLVLYGSGCFANIRKTITTPTDYFLTAIAFTQGNGYAGRISATRVSK